MIEDKLTHDERLRLECIAQANVTEGMHGSSHIKVLDVAEQYEKFVRKDSPVTATWVECTPEWVATHNACGATVRRMRLVPLDEDNTYMAVGHMHLMTADDGAPILHVTGEPS